MSTYNICFCGEIRKKYLLDTFFYLELCDSLGLFFAHLDQRLQGSL